MMADRCGSRLAVWMEAMTQSYSFQASGPRWRKAGSSWLIRSSENLPAHFALPLLMKRWGTRTRIERISPRSRSSGSDQAGLQWSCQANFVAQ